MDEKIKNIIKTDLVAYIMRYGIEILEPDIKAISALLVAINNNEASVIKNIVDSEVISKEAIDEEIFVLESILEEVIFYEKRKEILEMAQKVKENFNIEEVRNYLYNLFGTK